MGDAQAGLSQGQGVGILFGRERTGLENDEISLADAIITFPVDRAIFIAQLAQAVLLLPTSGRGSAAALPVHGDRRSPPAPRQYGGLVLRLLEAELDAVNFRPTSGRSWRATCGTCFTG